jgi:hypothetical protein
MSPTPEVTGKQQAAAGSEKIGDGSHGGHDTQPATILPAHPKQEVGVRQYREGRARPSDALT